MHRLGTELNFRLRQFVSILNDPLIQTGIKQKDHWEKYRNIVIVSTGRTGTHFFSHFFQHNFAQTLTTHQPEPDSFHINQHYVRKQISAHRAEMMFREFRHHLYTRMQQKGYRNYVESNPHIIALLPIARKVFGNYRIIFILRDGRDVVRSYYSKSTYGKWLGEAPYLSRRDPRVRLAAKFFPDDPYYSRWDSMNRFEKVCWIWAKKNEIVTNAIKDDPYARTFRFSNLFVHRNPKAWEELIQFTGMQKSLRNPDYLDYVARSKSNASSKYLIPKYHDWPDEYKSAFQEIAGPQTEKYGYDL